MLQNIKELYGKKLGASDGEVGRVKDFYFDDTTWTVRYLVADTGSWLSGRQVLISPHAFGRFSADAHVLPVNLTRNRIENSPPIESHRPVSRQFEEEYYRYYGWPTYWAGGAVWGVGGFPVATPPLTQTPPVPPGEMSRPSGDPHLRSTKEIAGYHIQTIDGSIGHVTGLMVDDRSWTIGELAVEAGHWYAGKEILIPPVKVDRIDYAESKVFVNLTKTDIEGTPKGDVVHAGVGSASH
jgi:sporulation protein YlmC with PRC-barrel domain